MNTAKLKLIDVHLGGRVRKLRLDLGALEDAEEASGYNFLASGVSGLNAKAVSALVWAALRHEDPGLTREQVREWIHLGNLVEVITAIGKAYVEAAPEPKPTKGAKAPGAPLARCRSESSELETSGASPA